MVPEGKQRAGVLKAARPFSRDSSLAARDTSLLQMLTLANSRARLWRLKAN